MDNETITSIDNSLEAMDLEIAKIRETRMSLSSLTEKLWLN